jgi:class 3 adenylate cyclase
MSGLPTGRVTFLFTDIEGSTWLLQNLGPGYDAVLREHYRLLRKVWQARGGCEVSTEGDAFFVVFADPNDAVLAAIDAQRATAAHPWPRGTRVRVRIGMHTGEAQVHDRDYVGLAVHVAARVAAAAHGGQVLVSRETRDAVGLSAGEVAFVDLGVHRLKDIALPVQLYRLEAALRIAARQPTRHFEEYARRYELLLPPRRRCQPSWPATSCWRAASSRS